MARRENWLEKQMQEAAEEIKQWPKWMRDTMRPEIPKEDNEY